MTFSRTEPSQQMFRVTLLLGKKCRFDLAGLNVPLRHVRVAGTLHFRVVNTGIIRGSVYKYTYMKPGIET